MTVTCENAVPSIRKQWTYIPHDSNDIPVQKETDHDYRRRAGKGNIYYTEVLKNSMFKKNSKIFIFNHSVYTNGE